MNVRISKEVKEALDSGKPVVAFESTIISHGMPYPQNVDAALRVEKECRDYGAIPATIGIIKGECVVGLSKEEIEELGTRKDVVKASRRDLAILINNKMYGATTVASTMIIANMAGIRVFATGGVGGVHRGAETSMDVSADLQELAHTNTLVICAGPKAILDLGLTLEYLETFGVPVLGYGVDKLPCFYSRTSKFDVDYKVNSPEEMAAIMKTKWDLGLNGGLLLANPIPEQYSLDNEEIEEIIVEGIKEMNAQGIKGKKTTPFLLNYVKEKTNGASLKSNIELVLNNARLGAKIAIEYARLVKEK